MQHRVVASYWRSRWPEIRHPGSADVPVGSHFAARLRVLRRVGPRPSARVGGRRSEVRTRALRASYLGGAPHKPIGHKIPRSSVHCVHSVHSVHPRLICRLNVLKPNAIPPPTANPRTKRPQPLCRQSSISQLDCACRATLGAPTSPSALTSPPPARTTSSTPPPNPTPTGPPTSSGATWPRTAAREAVLRTSDLA